MGLLKKQLAGWALLSLIAALILPVVSTAQENSDTVSLGVSPQILDLTANPGETLENTFRLTNASPQTVQIEVTPKNFVPRGEEGAVDLTVDQTTFSLADWLSVSPTETSIDTGDTRDFAVSIAVPENAEPGSHFGSVVFRTIPPENEAANALVSQEIAPVILVKIAGDTTETAEIAEFRSAKTTYSNESTIELLSRIENTGNVHFKPSGKVVIKNMWGSQVAEIDLDERNVLPDSIRQIATEWQPEGFQFGRYTAQLTIVFGENNEIRTADTSFIIFPYQVIIPILLVFGLVVFILVKFRKRLQLALMVLSGKDQPKSDE